MTGRMIVIASALVLAAAPGMAAAKDKVKRERALALLPISIDAPTEPASRVYSFRQGEFWGWQAARYRSAVTLAEPLPLPELWRDAVIPAGQPLFELQAVSQGFTGPLYCSAQQRNKKMAGTLMCLADRDRDGAMDQVWTGGVGSMKFLVPFPSIRSLKSIDPVRASRIEDPARLELQFGFYVSGTNPIFGTHHFYPMLSSNGEVGFPFTEAKNSVTLKDLPKAVGIAGAEIRVEAFENKQYRATVTRPYPAGERMLDAEVPKQTIYVYVPG
jgi:hypothetical protein